MSDLPPDQKPVPPPESSKVGGAAAGDVAETTTGRFSFWLRTVLGALLLVAAIAVIFVRHISSDSTDDAYITGHLHPVSARVSGTVTTVLVDDNQHVQAGQVLARLDVRDFDVRAELARAQIAQAVAQSLAAQAQGDQARAAISIARASVEKTRLDLARATELISDSPKGISQQEFDAAKAANQVALASLEAAVAQVAAAGANAAAAKAVLESGHANLSDAELARSYTDIVAPVSGRVGRKAVEQGARVNSGQTLLTVVSDELWVVANIKENQLTLVAPGDTVGLEIDAMPGLKFRGEVLSLAPATGAQFSLLPPDNATGNFTKVVQRLPIKIGLADPALQARRDKLFPGLSVVVTFKGHPAPSTRSSAALSSSQPS